MLRITLKFTRATFQVVASKRTSRFDVFGIRRVKDAQVALRLAYQENWALGIFQSCMMAIFSNFLERSVELSMDDFSIFGDSFNECLSSLEDVLKRCKKTRLVLHWEKCHFMVTEGIMLGDKISHAGLEVVSAKIDI
ncbi:reverse transcriptase [Cucumis melo var. makuwa]|uniref:Reverse transcriptase n=1 Tax=Cucumis melo var. makuwa TaxID=1194695 RepID=A0A5D3DF59_CUCMM|nr:reverse transcriptase [Cucumis melo var. makuwa]TYK22173.1 reverse transcriptase [Cucumis melo var. makuwa]